MKTATPLSLSPDLIIKSITWSPENPSINEIVTFTVTVKNQGTSQASNSRVSYFIDDAYITSNYLNPIDPGAIATKTFTWEAQAGSHTVKVIADFDNEVTESNETNNVKTYTFSTLAPDLIIESITWSPENPSKGDTATFSVKIKNQGTDSAGSCQVHFYVDDSSRGYQSVSRIDAGVTITKTFTWVAQAGSHIIKAIVDKDNLINESNETNNERTVEFSTFIPDLIIESITWSPEAPEEGDNVIFSVNITNQGDGRADYSQLAYFIDDFLLDLDSIDPIDPGASDNRTFNWKAKEGLHDSKAVTDYNERVVESDETNNTMTIIFSTLLPDLTIESITWLPEEPSVEDTVTFSVKIKNRGDGRVDASSVFFYIDSAYRGHQYIPEMEVDDTVTRTFTWKAQEGSHAIKAIVDKDDQILEINESNNEKSVNFAETSPPDLIVEGITWSPETPSIKDTVIFTVTIKNQGNGKASNSRVAYYIDDTFLTSDYLDPISPNATANETFTWKAQAGTQIIKAVADYLDWVTESDETNNEITATLPTMIPDLIISSITGSPENPSIEDTVTFTVTIKNQGNGKAGSSRVYFYVDDSHLGYQDVPELNVGASETKTFTWTAQAGLHDIKAVADHLDLIAESDETNNETMVTFPIPDLIIKSITGSPETPSIGAIVTFTVTIMNQGTSLADSSHIHFYVDDSSLSYEDVPELGAGATATKVFTWTAQAGTQIIKAVVDSDSEVSENDETNNEKTVTLSVPAPDLFIETVTWLPIEPAIGDNVTFTVNLTNQGTQSANSSLIYFYIDAAYQGYQDVPELEVSATVNKTFIWPAQAGLHTFQVVADKNNHIMESQESNNEETVTLSIALPPGPDPTPAPTTKPTPKPEPTPKPSTVPQTGESTPFPSLGKGIWLDLLFVLVLLVLIGTLVKGLMKPRQH